MSLSFPSVDEKSRRTSGIGWPVNDMHRFLCLFVYECPRERAQLSFTLMGPGGERKRRNASPIQAAAFAGHPPILRTAPNGHVKIPPQTCQTTSSLDGYEISFSVSIRLQSNDQYLHSDQAGHGQPLVSNSIKGRRVVSDRFVSPICRFLSMTQHVLRCCRVGRFVKLDFLDLHFFQIYFF